MKIFSTDSVPSWRTSPHGSEALAHSPAFRSVLPTGRWDVVSISPAGKASQLLEALNKQRQGVVEHKNALIAETLENGMGLDTIEAQVDLYDEQLRFIDEMIAQAMADQARQAAEKQAPAKKQASEEPLTEDEAQMAQTRALSEAATRLDKAKMVSQAYVAAENQSRIMSSQIDADKERMQAQNPKPGNDAPSRQYVAGKEEALSGMRGRAGTLFMQSGKVLGDAYQSAEKLGEVSAQSAEARRNARQEEEEAYRLRLLSTRSW